MQLHSSATIRHKLIDGLVVILNLKSGSYYILDEVASVIWQAYIENACDEDVLSRLADVFDAEPARMKADFDSFKRNCIEKGFLVTTGSNPDIAQARFVRVTFPVWHAWCCIVRAAMSLRWRGFEVTYSDTAGLVVSCETKDVDHILSAALRAFLLAENFAPLRRAPKDCLPRSLALFRFLRNMGIPVEHCIGVDRYPFHAHAWVEYRGEVLLDADRRAQFTTLARIEA